MRLWTRVTTAAAAGLFVNNANVAALSARGPRVRVAKPVQTFPHSEDAFTEKLTFLDADGVLLGNTELKGKSFISAFEVDREQPLLRQISRIKLPGRHFRGGITLWGDEMVSLMWRSRQVCVFDRHSLTIVDKMTLDRGMGEGWGLTVFQDGTRLIASDGSAVLPNLS